MDFAGSEVRIQAGKGGQKDIKKVRNVMSRRTVLFSGGQDDLLELGSPSWCLRRNMFLFLKFDLPYTV
jgi:hypothetical protein